GKDKGGNQKRTHGGKSWHAVCWHAQRSSRARVSNVVRRPTAAESRLPRRGHSGAVSGAVRLRRKRAYDLKHTARVRPTRALRLSGSVRARHQIFRKRARRVWMDPDRLSPSAAGLPASPAFADVAADQPIACMKP